MWLVIIRRMRYLVPQSPKLFDNRIRLDITDVLWVTDVQRNCESSSLCWVEFPDFVLDGGSGWCNHIGRRNARGGPKVMKTRANDVRTHEERDLNGLRHSFVTGVLINWEKLLRRVRVCFFIASTMLFLGLTRFISPSFPTCFFHRALGKYARACTRILERDRGKALFAVHDWVRTVRGRLNWRKIINLGTKNVNCVFHGILLSPRIVCKTRCFASNTS